MSPIESVNFVARVSFSNEKLFFCRAFVIGFGHHQRGLPWREPVRGGASGSPKSPALSYERGRQFAALWGKRPVSNLTEMQAALQEWHNEGLIL